MSRLLLFTGVCIGIVFANPYGPGKPDFTGDWLLNLDRSNFGNGKKPMGMTLKVTRDAGMFRAVQTTETPGGPSYVESHWILDGKEHEANGAPQKVLTKWEGNTLYSERRADDGSLNQKIWLTISADGQTAIEKVYTQSPQGVNISNLVWIRQHPK